jgi:hypothetical protein
MKKLIITSMCLLFGLSSFSQTPEEMKAWEAYMTPSESHKWLATMDGEWGADITMWMDPSQPPVKSKGTTSMEMIFDGRYQLSKHIGEYGGMPFYGQNLVAFDNAKKKFISTWIDTMGTGIMILEGTYDSKTKTMNLSGNMVDPISGSDMKVREVVTYTSDDSHKFEMFIVLGDTEMKSMEIIYNRKK